LTHFTQIPSAAHLHGHPVTGRQYRPATLSLRKSPQTLMFSIKRISRLSPNLQQFSCTFVKPKKGSIHRYPPEGPPLANEFNPVRQKQRRIAAYQFLHIVAYFE
jgi:hypothetical protein